MKFLNKKTVALLALLGMTGYSFGYDFGVANATDKALVVKLQLRSISLLKPNYAYELIKPNEQKVFHFGGENMGTCLESIYVAPYNETYGNNFGSYAIQFVDMVMVPKGVHDTTTESGDIKKAAEKLIETTLCTNRNFTIIATGEKVTKNIGTRVVKTNLDEYLAVTPTTAAE